MEKTMTQTDTQVKEKNKITHFNALFQAVDKVKKSTAFCFQIKEYMVLYLLSWMTSFQIRKF